MTPCQHDPLGLKDGPCIECERLLDEANFHVFVRLDHQLNDPMGKAEDYLRTVRSFYCRLEEGGLRLDLSRVKHAEILEATARFVEIRFEDGHVFVCPTRIEKHRVGFPVQVA